MHRHNPTILLVDLQEPGVIKAHNRCLWPLRAAQADLLTTVHPVFIIEGKNAVGPLVLKPVDQFLQHGHGSGYETVRSQGLQARPVLLIVFFDEVVDTMVGLLFVTLNPQPMRI